MKFLNADMESVIEIFVPHITLVDAPPSTSASEVSGLTFEKVASESGWPSPLTGTPSSPTKTLLLFEPAKVSEWISLLREVNLPEAGPDRRNRPLLLDGASDLLCCDLEGLEVGSYLRGEDSPTLGALEAFGVVSRSSGVEGLGGELMIASPFDG